MPKDGRGRRAAPTATVGRPQRREQRTRHVPDRRQCESSRAKQGDDRGADSRSPAVRRAVSKASGVPERAADDAVVTPHDAGDDDATLRGCVLITPPAVLSNKWSP